MILNGLRWLEMHFKHHLFFIFVENNPVTPPKCGIYHTFFWRVPLLVSWKWMCVGAFNQEKALVDC